MAQHSYKDAGVDIDTADDTKRSMAKSLQGNHPLVLNAFGAFASLVDGKFADYTHPVLVCKTEEPGSKQLLAFAHDRIESVCADMINHLINDIVVMGAMPLFIQDCIVCGKIEKEKVLRIVDGISIACKAQGCTLTGGETSEQPGSVALGTYILTASGIGVVEKARIIDGSRIAKGDIVLAVASNGLHTNGYSLVRSLIERHPAILEERINGTSAIDAILTPHFCYYHCIKKLFDLQGLHGIAHITGGGIPGNLHRILPSHLDARISAASLQILDIFHLLQRYAHLSDTEALRTFNLGVGLTLILHPDTVDHVRTHLRTQNVDSYPIGEIVEGSGVVAMTGNLSWKKA